ncbi:MAG TPA: hypothetical protein VG738_00845 [Chitinophagaceae bacterium]|nr:hypothetical protein [Chitinophagaceae bacterium]
MKKRTVKKILKWTGISFLSLVAILALHIYIVTRPKAPDAHTRIMARIDIKQEVSNDEQAKITTWMYQQKGIDHVLYNPASKILVFTYYPVKTNANTIADNFTSAFGLKAERVVPTEEEMQSGCPVALTSPIYKAYSFVKHIF